MRHFIAQRGARRATSLTALVAGLALVTSMPSMAHAAPELTAASTRQVVPIDDLVPMINVDAADFEAEAEELPAELEAALERDVQMTTAEWLAQAEAAAVAVDVVDALREHIEVVDSRLEGTELVVTVESAADAKVVESVGATAELGTATEGRETAVIEGLEPAADLRGGMPYSYPPGFRCSMGYVGKDVSTNATQVLTAGHCEGNPGSTRTSMTITAAGGTGSGNPTGLGASTVLGPAGLHVTDRRSSSSSSYYDHGIIRVTNTSWTPKPEVVSWGLLANGAPLASEPVVVRDAIQGIIGATICKSGASSGWTCGEILEVANVYPIGGSTCSSADYCVGGILAEICVRSGDSGGAALVGNAAVGITSASDANADGNSDCDEGGVGIFSHVASTSYEAASDVFPNWEPLIEVATPTVNVSGTVFSGTLEHGTSRHFVDVVFSTGEKRTATVQSNGTWSVDTVGTSPLTKSYTVTARWGKGSLSSSVSGTLEGISTSRLSGDSRYSTAIAISKAAFPGMPNVPVVYIANGANFPDALSAGPAAAAEGGPLLLTEGGSLPSAVRTELNRLNPTTIVIVGGSSVVSGSVANALGSYADSVVRIGGANRYETSRLIAQRGITLGFFTTNQQLWVATGANYADALSAGAAAASAGVPILLVNGTASGLDSATRSFLASSLRPTVARIAGGTSVVSNGVKNAIDAVSGVSTARYGGANRYATSLLINEYAHPTTAPSAYLTYGQNFPDALAGGVLAGLSGGPMYITQTSCVEDGIVDHILDLDVDEVVVFGGTGVVSNAARDLRRC